MTEEITREDGPTGGRYALRRGGAEAVMTYSRLSPTRIAVDHTGVPDAMRGTGAGLLLAERLVTDARDEGVRAVPRCAFVKVQAERHPEWSDVIEGA